MAEKKQPKVDPEVQRQKKEEQARRSRRRTRQLFGLVLTVFIIVGAFSIIGTGIDLVRGLLDDTEERLEFQQRVETMVWFDVLPFNDVNTLDEETLRQVAIWGVYNDQRDALQTNEDDAILVPVLEVDKYIRALFGPGFTFSEHGSFTEPSTAMLYVYLEDIEAYVLPATSGVAEYMPIVVDMTRISGGGRRVSVGYASTLAASGAIVNTIDYDHPAKYMDFVFYRDGSEYYLERLERNTSIEVTTADDGAGETPQPGFDDSTSLPGEDDDLLGGVEPDGSTTSLPGEDSSLPEDETGDSSELVDPVDE